MRTILVSLLVLAACEQAADFGVARPTEAAAKPTPIAPPAAAPAPEPTRPPLPHVSERRANGDGFTIALAGTWEAVPVDPGNVFRARLDGGGSLEIMKLPDRDRDVPRSEHLCQTWAEKMARSMGGTTSGGRLANGSCIVQIATSGMTFHLEALERTSAYASICVGLTSAAPIDKECASMIASWRDDAKATAKRHQSRVVISREQDHPVARTSSFTVTFPVDWRVTEGTNDALVQGTTDDDGVVAISFVDSLGAITAAECDGFGQPIAEMFKATLRGAKMERTGVGLGCRISMSGGLFRWVYVLTASDNKSYMFACGALKGEAPEAACEQIFASWTFKRGA